jgi:hypothetical protein
MNTETNASLFMFLILDASGTRNFSPLYKSCRFRLFHMQFRKYLHILDWLLVPHRPGTPAYMLQPKTKGKVCVHTLSRATAVPEPASLFREGSDTATCSRL